jgi:hypothetical protein
VIVNPPVSQSVFVGQSATFTVLASGSGTLNYQWWRLPAGTSTPVQLSVSPYQGVATAALTVQPITIGMNGDTFWCVVTSLYGSATSSAATLAVNTANIAVVRHGFELNGNSGIDGSIQVVLAENVTLNGYAWIAADLIMPGTPIIKLNGHGRLIRATVNGDGSSTPSSHKLTLNGNAIVDRLVQRTTRDDLPAVGAPPLPTGTRDVSLNSPGQSAGAFNTIRNLTLNGNAGTVAVPGGTYGKLTSNGNSKFRLGIAGSSTATVYDLQELTLNGNSQLEIVGPVLITVLKTVDMSGNAGTSAHPDWLLLRVAAGGLKLNGGMVFSGFVLAPNGTITINGTSKLLGGISGCNDLKIDGYGLLDLSP